MLYLSFIYHMHQPYYKDLLTKEAELPWVRLHGIKDYQDMVLILKDFPKIKLTFNLVPSLLEQINDYTQSNLKDKFYTLSYKAPQELTCEEKKFIIDNFFHTNLRWGVSVFPRYYELYLKRQNKQDFNAQDILDLQVWFNLAWYDPSYRKNIPQLNDLIKKARFFNAQEKNFVLDKQMDILKEIIPTYKNFKEKNQIEIITSPYYHPILPLLYHTKTAKEANPQTALPKKIFSFPQDALAQIREAKALYKNCFGDFQQGLWPSEQAVSQHIVDFFIAEGINWIITDEGILFKSLKKKRRNAELIYQPHFIKTEQGSLNIIFRDRNLSDLISFVYYQWEPKDAVNDFLNHLKNIHNAYPDKNPLVCVAMDGENAWEYYKNDGWDFLSLLYQKISESDFIHTVTISDYLKNFPAQSPIKRLACGSWIFANLNKWIGAPLKNLAWEYLALAREKLEEVKSQLSPSQLNLGLKQIYILEGSDWFWWANENNADFDRLFLRHLFNFYNLIGEPLPAYLKGKTSL